MRTDVYQLSHTSHAAVRRDELAATLEQMLPRIASNIESSAMFLLLSAFWGLILYMAATAL